MLPPLHSLGDIVSVNISVYHGTTGITMEQMVDVTICGIFYSMQDKQEAGVPFFYYTVCTDPSRGHKFNVQEGDIMPPIKRNLSP